MGFLGPAMRSSSFLPCQEFPPDKMWETYAVVHGGRGVLADDGVPPEAALIGVRIEEVLLKLEVPGLTRGHTRQQAES